MESFRRQVGWVVTDQYKSRLCAAAGIPIYWLINLVDRCLEVMSDPSVVDGFPVYTKSEMLQLTDFFPVLIEGQIVGTVCVGDLFC